MSSINAGNQTILWRYRTPLVGGDLARMHSNILVPGIYTGMGVSREGDLQVKVDPGEAMIEDASPGESRIVKIAFAAQSVITVVYPNKFLVLRYTWRDSLDHYAEFLSVPTMGASDLLVAAIEYEDAPGGGFMIKALDTDSRPSTPNDLLDTFFGNLKPEVAFAYHRSITVAPGNFSLHGVARLSPGDLLTFDASNHADGRWDTVGTLDGALLVYKGAEGGDVLPPGDFFPVCHVHIRQGVEYLLGTDIVDARPFFFYSHGIPSGAVSYQDLAQGFDNEYGVTTPAKILDVSVAVSGRDAMVTFSPQANLTNLLGYHLQVSPDAGTTWYPLGTNGYDPNRPGATTSFYVAAKEIKGLSHGVGSGGTAIPQAYQVRVRQVTSAGAMSPWSEPVPFSTAPYTIGDIAAGSITDAALAPESMAAKVVSNFSSANDRIATVPADPTTPSDNSSVDHTDNMDDSVNISFEWVFDGVGDGYNIDGFVVYVHMDASPVDYNFGSDPVTESTYYVNPDRRALIMYGAPKDKYYTFGVRAYRVVDNDIDPSGLLTSVIVKPSGSEERPYNPQVSAAHEGDIGSTVVAPPALAVLDTTAPSSAGAMLAVSQETDGSLTVSWSGFTDTGVGIFGYKVFRKYGSSQFVIADVSGVTASYNDSNIEVGNSYQYSVSAYDRNGNECPQFPWSASTTSVVSAQPPAPAGLTATGMTGYVEISFAPVHAPFLRHYLLYRSDDGGFTWPAGNNVLLAGTTYFDFGLTSITSTRYKVQAVLSSGQASLETPAVSVVATSFTPAAGSAPDDILSGDHAVTDMANGTLQVNWPQVTGASLYRIFRKRSDLSEWVLQATVPADARPFVDTTVEAGKAYLYAVRAISSSGMPNTGAFSSNVSNTVTCTDSQPPVIPALNVTPLVGAVRLSWTTDYKKGTRYHLYRCSGSWDDLNANRIALVLGGGKSTWDYTDAFGADVPLNFSYKMRTEDTAGNLSGFSPVPSLLTSLIVPEFPPDSLKVLHWSFDDGGQVTADTITDTSQTNSDGRTYGTVQWVSGKSGYMLRLNGNGYAKSATGCELDVSTATAVSYSLWASTYVTGRYLFLHGTEDVCGLDVRLTTNGGALVRLYNADGIDGVNTSYSISLPAGTFQDSMDSYQLVVDNSTQRLFVYKGGFYGTSFALPGQMKMPYGSYGQVVVGADAVGAYKLIGDIDEFMVFRTVLQAKHARALHQFVTNAAQGSMSAIGTRYYRLPGAPSTVPVPASVHIRYNVNATMDVTLFWQQYYNGAIPANFLTVFCKSATSDPGIPDYTDDSTVVPVNLTDVGSFVFAGLTPDREYSFGIAAGRNTETGALLTTIATKNHLESPVWVDVNLYQLPNFTGTVDGIDLASRLDDFSETLFGTDSPPSDLLGKNGDLYHNTATSMEWVKVSGGWTPSNLGAVSVVITGGTRTMSYNSAGILQTSILEYGLDVKRNGISVNPSNCAWNAYGCLSGTQSGSSKVFTPSSTSHTNASTYVRVIVTVDSVTYIDIAPVAVSRHGADGTSVTIVGSVPEAADLPDPYTGAIGDGYVTEDDGHLHIWTGTVWDDVGEIRGPPGIAGADGEDGSAGVDARAVNLTCVKQGFSYNTSGARPATPETTVVTATALNTDPLKTVYYRFVLNDTTVLQHTISNTITYTQPAAYTSMPEKIEVEIREGGTGNDVLARDQITMYGLRAGGNAITVMLTNEAHTLPTTVGGTVNYNGSGTSIRVWEGATQLTVDQNSPYAASTFRVAAAVVSGTIVIGTASGNDGATERIYGVHSGMDTDVAVIRYTITVTDSAGTARAAIIKDQTLTKSWQGITGNPGSNARSVSLAAPTLAFAYNTAGSSPSPVNTVVTATRYNGSGTAYYRFLVNGAQQQAWGITATYTYPAQASFSNMPQRVTVEYSEVSDGSIVLAIDEIVMVGLKEASSAVTTLLTNEAHSVPAESDGSSPVFTGSGTDIQAWIGTTALAYGTGNSQFSVTADADLGITAGAATTPTANVRRYAPITAMSIDLGKITFTITVKDAAGTSSTFTRIQTLNKSRKGTQGYAGYPSVIVPDMTPFVTGGTAGGLDATGGQRFTVTNSVRLLSVVVYAYGSYTKAFSLLRGATVVATKNVVLVNGYNRFTLDWIAEPGDTYTLQASAGNGTLYRNSDGYTYPRVYGSLTITSNTWANNGWYFFYDLEVSGAGVSAPSYRNLGEWSSIANLRVILRGDLVTYSGSAYECIADHGKGAGAEPTVTAYWSVPLVTTPYTVQLSNESHVISCDRLGQIVSGEIGSGSPATCAVKVYRGSTELAYGTGADQWTMVLTPDTGVILVQSNDTFYLTGAWADAGQVAIAITTVGGPSIARAFRYSKQSPGWINPVNFSKLIAGATSTALHPIIIGAGAASANRGGTSNIVSRPGPFGSSVPVWECVSTQAATDNGGIGTCYITAVKTNRYRLSVFFHVENLTGRWYFGPPTGRGNFKAITTGADTTNPYLISSNTFPSAGKWYLAVGYVYEEGYAGTVIDPTSGVYDVLTRVKITGLSAEYAMTSDVLSIGLRAFLYSTPDANQRLRFYAPRLDVVDGSEPSLEDLLEGRAVGPSISLSSSSLTERYDKDGTNTTGDITLTASPVNNVGAVVFTTSPTVTLTGTGNTRVLTAANFGSNTQVTITATVDSVASDFVTIVRVQDGPTGLTGAAGLNGKTYILTITGGKRTILYNAAGSSPTPTMTAFGCTLTEDGVTVTPTSYTWAVPASNSLLSGSSTASTFTPTVAGTFVAASADNVVTLTVVYAGRTVVETAPISMFKIGDTGTAGNYQQEVPVYYQGTVVPTAPSGGTYKFSDGAIGVPTGGGVTWVSVMPVANMLPTWRTSALFSTNTPSVAVAPFSVWSPPRTVGQNGSRKHSIIWG